MLIGTAVMAVLGLLAALPLWLLGLLDGGSVSRELGLLFLCYGAGMVGALVSVMSRLRPGAGSVRSRGRRDLRRPPVRHPEERDPAGATGVRRVPGQPVFYFAVAAFLAGFSERWVHVIIGGAKRTIAPGKPDEDEEKEKEAEKG